MVISLSSHSIHFTNLSGFNTKYAGGAYIHLYFSGLSFKPTLTSLRSRSVLSLDDGRANLGQFVCPSQALSHTSQSKEIALERWVCVVSCPCDELGTYPERTLSFISWHLGSTPADPRGFEKDEVVSGFNQLKQQANKLRSTHLLLLHLFDCGTTLWCVVCWKKPSMCSSYRVLVLSLSFMLFLESSTALYIFPDCSKRTIATGSDVLSPGI